MTEREGQREREKVRDRGRVRETYSKSVVSRKAKATK